MSKLYGSPCVGGLERSDCSALQLSWPLSEDEGIARHSVSED